MGFYTSPFYAKCGGPASLNERRRRGEVVAAGTIAGPEFLLAYTNEVAQAGRTETSVFVVERVIHKEGLVETFPSDVFYIIAGTIYKAPKVWDFVDSVLQVAAGAAEGIMTRQVEELDHKRQRLATEHQEPVATNDDVGGDWP